MFDEIRIKNCIETKKTNKKYDRRIRSTTLNDIKPVEIIRMLRVF